MFSRLLLRRFAHRLNHLSGVHGYRSESCILISGAIAVGSMSEVQLIDSVSFEGTYYTDCAGGEVKLGVDSFNS